MGPHYLDRLFTPQAIAVFGASKRTNAVGTRVYNNLLESGFTGPIYPINPKYDSLNDNPCYPDIVSIAQPVDLAVIATPAPTVPEIIHACGEHGVRAAIRRPLMKRRALRIPSTYSRMLWVSVSCDR